MLELKVIPVNFIMTEASKVDSIVNMWVLNLKFPDAYIMSINTIVFTAFPATETTEIISTTFQVSAIYQQNYEIHVKTSVIS